MMKKRHDEGFALAYVVVVIFILCSIAIALMSSTLRTLQAQETMVRRMQDKYEAMGEIERLVAELEADLFDIDYQITADGYEDEIVCSDDALIEFNSFMSNYGEDINANEEFVYSVSYSADSITVNATLSVIPNILIDYHYKDVEVEVENPLEPGQTITETQSQKFWYYIVELSNPTFVSYKISSAEGGESGA